MSNPFKRGSKARVALAYWLMMVCYRIVERIDRGPVPKCSPWAFTYEANKGAVINNSGGMIHHRRGALLWYINDRDYERAHEDSISLNSETH